MFPWRDGCVVRSAVVQLRREGRCHCCAVRTWLFRDVLPGPRKWHTVVGARLRVALSAVQEPVQVTTVYSVASIRL
ncbi:hypothetical protein Mapa_006686 [Marchantia paleacea]|nr:hypothetical protein Mapa_006686 [Marchantia paleacea]